MKSTPTPPKKFGKMSIGFICSATLSVVKEPSKEPSKEGVVVPL